jgi:dUTP pyrophosphatase
MPSEPVSVQVKRLNNGASLPLPGYASDGAAGMDVCAAEGLTLKVGKRHAVATGLSFAIPHGFEVQVRPRSGLALKHGITCLNTPGTIDSDYRGERGFRHPTRRPDCTIGGGDGYSGHDGRG